MYHCYYTVFWVFNAFPIGMKGFSPYTMTQCHSSRHEQSSYVKIRAPYIDGDYSSPDFVPYGKVGYALSLIPFHLIRPCTDLTTSSFSQCPGPVFAEADIFESGKWSLSFWKPPFNRPYSASRLP